MGRLITGLVGRRLSGAGLAYAGAEEVNTGIGAQSRLHEGFFAAQSMGDLARAEAERQKAFDNILFGLGRAYRYIIENGGEALGLGGVSADEKQAMGMEYDTEDALWGEYYKREQARIAAEGAAARQAAALPTRLPSERITAGVVAMNREARDTAASAREALAAEVTRQQNVLHEKFKHGDVSRSEYKRLAGIIDSTENAELKRIGQQETAAEALARVEQRRATIAAEDETVARIGGQREGLAAEALRRGRGGEDVVFALQQAQERTEAEQKVRKGEMTPEEQQGLLDRQAQEREKREREINLRIQGDTAEWSATMLAREGRFYEARQALFEKSAAERLNAVREKSKDEIDIVKDQINAERQLMERQHEWEMQGPRAESALAVQVAQGQAAAMTLRARGQFFRAGEKEFHTQWDARLQAAADAFAAEHDVEKRGLLQNKYVALLDESHAAERERKALQARDVEMRHEQVQVTEHEAKGQQFTAALMDIKNRADWAFRDAAGNAPLQREIREQEAADIKREQFQIRMAGFNQPGQAVRHGFEVDLSGRLLGRNPFEKLSDVMQSGNDLLKSIDAYLKQQAALAAK